jgi:hypothetical protein
MRDGLRSIVILPLAVLLPLQDEAGRHAGRHESSLAEGHRIEALIDALQTLAEPTWGIQAGYDGPRFLPLAPVEDPRVWWIGAGRVAEFEPLTRLVTLGPKALPYLLEHLDDARPTQLAFSHDSRCLAGMGGMHLALEGLALSPLGPTEQRAARRHSKIHGRTGGLGESQRIEQHTVTVGDACFVAIGEITGRPYEAVRYQMTCNLVVNSPTARPELARFVRDLWQGTDPVAELYARLLEDLKAGDSQRWERRNNAIQRLAFYYPDEALPLLLTMLREQLDAPLPEKRTEPEGHVPLLTLLGALRFCARPEVIRALREAVLRFDDPRVLIAAMGKPLAAAEPELVTALVLRALQRGPHPDHYELVSRSLDVLPDPEPLFAWTLSVAPVWVRAVGTAALEESSGEHPWAVDLLLPLLDDSTPTGEARSVLPGGALTLPVRVCDAAAGALQRRLDPTARFELCATLADTDAKIAELRSFVLHGR